MHQFSLHSPLVCISNHRIPEEVTYRSLGRYSCVGKQLALIEVRSVTARIVHLYNVALAPGQTAEAFLKGKKDTFTLSLGPLEMVFNDRKV